MSCNRENVIWKDRNGKWNLGFFHCYPVDQDKEDWDYEWDVDYDFSTFDWVSTGHDTQEAAHLSWGGSNPGMWEVHEEPSEYTDEFDKMAATYRKQLTSW